MEFLTELIKRLFAKTPWFFKVVQIVSVVALVIVGLPGVIESVCEEMQICFELPAAWNAIYSKALSIALAVSAFVAQLTVTSEEKKAKSIPE